jgi:hypothetical protein
MSLWIYIHRAEGIWQRIPFARFDRFTDGKDQIPNPSGTTVEFAEVWVDLESRVPVDLIRLIFYKMPIYPDGSLDRKRDEEITRAQFESIGADWMLPAHGSKEHLMAVSRARFARRRADYLAGWRPSAADREALRLELTRRGLAWDGISTGRLGPRP